MMGSTSCEIGDRRELLLKMAKDRGMLVDISSHDSESWRKEWRSVVSCLSRPFLPKRPTKPRAVAPPREMLQPGTWIAFRPHLGSPEQRCFVVAVVPSGTRIDHVLSPLQIGLLERHTCLSASARYTRVIVAIPGIRKSVSHLRPVLAGALGARGRVIESMDTTERLQTPVPPGKMVSWNWACGRGRTHYHGTILCFIPAGVPILDLLPQDDLRLRGGTQMVSIQDRYAAKSPDGLIHFPPAFAVEQGLYVSPTFTTFLPVSV